MQTDIQKRLEELKKTYTTKPFDTTTEAMEFMEDFSDFSSLQEKINGENIPLNEVFKILKPAFVKKIVSNYLLKNGEKVDYENYFLGKLELLLTLFMMIMQDLGEAVNEGNEKPQLTSAKRNLG